MSHAPYHLDHPTKWTSNVVFASPHSGTSYSRDFIEKSVLSAHMLRSSEDAFVDRLFCNVTDFGAVLMRATYPRAWLDLNRREDELDPALIEGLHSVGANPRILSGLGVVPRVVAGGRSIYHGKISASEAAQRVETVWRPYHDRLEQLLAQTKQRFGASLLIDCHSMPRDALKSARTPNGKRPQIVLGDRYGASCSREIYHHVEEALRDAGFEVARNMPFAGAYIAQQYGHPVRHQHAVQIEIDRSLYMNEATIEPNADFDAVKMALTQACKTIIDYGIKTPLAAE